MIRLSWFLAKMFLATASTAIFIKWLYFYLNLPALSGTPVQYWATGGIIGTVGFIIGLSWGLIWGEENASKRYNTLWHDIYHKNSPATREGSRLSGSWLGDA